MLEIYFFQSQTFITDSLSCYSELLLSVFLNLFFLNINEMQITFFLINFDNFVFVFNFSI